MREAVVIRHVAFEDLAAFADPIEQAGYAIRYRDAGIDDPTPEEARAPDLLVVLGGPIGAHQDDRYPFLRGTREALAIRLEAGAPTLGICLGAQLMAAALGARVAPGPVRE
ncbi:glutamine amidotransferase, partial [Xanthomonas citri pv. citri]